MDTWPNMDIEDMLPPQYKKGPCKPKKLRFIEHDESGSRMSRHGVAYRCTKYDKFGNNSRKCHSKEHDLNALKRKKRTPRTKAFANDAEIEGVSKINAPESVHGINDPNLDAQLKERMTYFEHTTDVAQIEKA
ncbi:unnamed protein product [Lathyrus oleraceus]